LSSFLAQEKKASFSSMTSKTFQEIFGDFTTFKELNALPFFPMDYRVLDTLVRKDLGCERRLSCCSTRAALTLAHEAFHRTRVAVCDPV
jgi:hypothetical protein